MRILCIVILTVFGSSCKLITQSIIGIKDPIRLSDKEIEKCSKGFKVDQNASYKLDSTYLSYLLSLDTSKCKEQIKNHLQPLQALYFNSNGLLVKHYINCYAGGFPNLKWNRNGNLETFPPNDQAPTDTLLNLNKLLTLLMPVCATTDSQVVENSDYYVFIYWNKCAKRHSKTLIKVFKKNISKATNNKVKLIYVNYDNVFSRL